MERLTTRGPPGHPHQGEASACWQLTVRVLEARNLGWTDLLSQADPYVTLQLPTAPGIKFKTKTITNSSHPVWNETFSFLIQSQVKNVLELNVYDEDSVTEDDACFKVLYDVSEVQPGELLRKTFSLRPQGQEELDVEFLLEKTSDCPENLITNNVLVARELSCLDVRLDSAESTARVTDEEQLKLELVLKGSYEDTQTSALGTASAFRFHYLAAQETELSVRLRSSESNDWNSDKSAGHLTVPLRSLAMGKEVTVNVPVINTPGVRLQLKAEGCPKELAVRLGYDLCAEEKAFLSRRKRVVARALKQTLQLDRDLQEDEVPVVGIMATGGGARAMTSLYGHLLALQKLGLLDCVTYFSGISGSTWAMAHLYGDPEWSQKDLEGPIKYAREHLAKSKLEAFSPERLASYRQELELRAKQGYPTTFVDLWALVLESMLHGQVMDQKLSEQRAALEQGQNPLPLYLSLNVKENDLETLDFKEWVEFSPYEVGFPKYGAFVPTELFGSEFFMGRLMRRLPESRICFLEGIWSNIFSLNLLDAWYDLTNSGDTWKQHIKDKIRNLEESPASLTTSSWLEPGTALAKAFKGFLTSRPLHQHSCNFLRGLQLHQDYCSHKDFSTWADCQLDSTPGQLTPQEPRLCLVDVGYFLNTSCPSMFLPGRRLDLILSLDYSLSAPFEALQQTELYCRARGLPFPRVDPSPQDQRQPTECHLFSDPTCPDAPVLLHFPLVSASFKDHSAPGVQRSPAELPASQVDLTGTTSPYYLFNMTYKEEDFDHLLQLSDYNVRNSQGAILQALRTAMEHRALGTRPPTARN
ncbi:cytosolic phospholipase A2 delta [Canis lupus dingo]|uniref:cytosolic phospholipase A2 delta n=1 Tax=Canis lupus dingo TaxID=286419 RepID=UPI000DC67099|nr:cytosolic phospholipase A2 delta [Canis lupus dingo]